MTASPDVLEQQVKDMKEDVNAILTNHLPHIYEELKALGIKVEELRGMVKWYVGVAFGGIALLNILIAFAAVYAAIRK